MFKKINIASLVLPLVLAVASTSAFAQGWSFSGPGNTSLSSPSANVETASYGLSGGDVYSTQTWTLSNVAASKGDYTFNWDYSGDHAYFNVHAELNAFTSNGEVGLYNPPNANCCSAPSNGFHESGTYHFGVLNAGDSYGFTMRGSNFDSDAHLVGTLSVNNVSAVPEPETYAMLLAGLGLMGFMVRRKSAKKAV